MGLPASLSDKLGDGGTFGALQQRDDLSLFRARADGDRLWCSSSFRLWIKGPVQLFAGAALSAQGQIRRRASALAVSEGDLDR